ncbi:MAG TPA: hypothetical protein VEH04_07390 [Verrucomicrobiae bacterium]|nr:hypothetical protein [Verrucomicrobiae bacterium]
MTPKIRTRILVIVVVVAVFTLFTSRPVRSPQFDSRLPESIEYIVWGERIALLTNVSGIMTVLTAGKAVRAHDCTPAGQFVLHYSGGRRAEVWLQPGHHEDQYEFVYDGYFSIPRSAFISTLRSAGVDETKIPK